MRDFSQGLYTFSLRLELYLPGRAPNRVGPQRGRVANLGRKSWSRGHVIANTGQPGFSRQYWSSWPLSSILVANLGIEVHDECSTESSYLLTGSVPLQYPPSTPEVSESHISRHGSWRGFGRGQNQVHVHVRMLFMDNNASCSSCLRGSCVRGSFRGSCIRGQSSIPFFYPSSRGRPRRMVFMEFFYQNWCVFLYRRVRFPCSSFVSFPFDQEFESCGFRVPFHVINRVNKVRAFFIFNNRGLWWRHLPADRVVFRGS